MKEYYTFHRSLELEPDHQTQLSVVLRTPLFFRGNPQQKIDSAFSKLHWQGFIVKGVQNKCKNVSFFFPSVNRKWLKPLSDFKDERLKINSFRFDQSQWKCLKSFTFKSVNVYYDVILYLKTKICMLNREIKSSGRCFSHI